MSVNAMPTFIIVLLTIIYIICLIASIKLDKNKVNINKQYAIIKRTISIILFVIMLFIHTITALICSDQDSTKYLLIIDTILLILCIIPAYILIFTNKKTRSN